MIDRRVPNWAAVGVGFVGIGIGVAVGWGVFASAKATAPSPPASQQESTAPSAADQGVLENCARSALGEMDKALHFFFSRDNKYPTNLDEISGVLAGKRVPADPWGRPYVYSVAEDRLGFTLHTNGPDGRPGTGDDFRITRSSRDARRPSTGAPPSAKNASFKIRGQKTVSGMCKMFLEIVAAEPGLRYVKVFAIAENKSVLDSVHGYLPKGYGAGTLFGVSFFSTPCSRISSIQFEFPVAEENMTVPVLKDTDGLPESLLSATPIWEALTGPDNRGRELRGLRVYDDGMLYAWSQSHRAVNQDGRMTRVPALARWRLDAAVKPELIHAALAGGFADVASTVPGPTTSDGSWRVWRGVGAGGSVHIVYSPSGVVPDAVRAVELAVQQAVLPGAVPIDNGP